MLATILRAPAKLADRASSRIWQMPLPVAVLAGACILGACILAHGLTNRYQITSMIPGGATVYRVDTLTGAVDYCSGSLSYGGVVFSCKDGK